MNDMPLTAAVVNAFSESPAIWLMLLVVGLLGLLKSARFKGMIGEIRVRITTDFLLDGKEYHPLHNLTLKTPDGTTQIDHVLVSPYGVFVIETKNLKGWIFGDSKAKRWTQTLFRKKYQFQNPLHQNFKHDKAVENHLSLDSRVIHSVIVFVGKSRFRTLMPPNVVDIRGFSPYIRSKTDRLLDDTEIARAKRELNAKQITFFGVGRSHVRNLKRNAEQPICPRCGKEMVLRTARNGRSAGNQFWGCTGYPTCRSTRQVNV